AEPLPASQDRQIRLDGDLREFLIDRPKKARDVEDPPGRDGWMGLSAYASRYNGPSDTFAGLLADGFRRSATTSWRFGENGGVYINLTQFRQVDTLGASLWADNGVYWANREKDTRSWPIPGTGEHAGTVYVHDTPDRKPGYLPLYTAEAHAWRGDVYVEIFVHDSGPIPKPKIMALAKRQVGKLGPSHPRTPPRSSRGPWRSPPPTASPPGWPAGRAAAGPPSRADRFCWPVRWPAASASR